MKSIKNMFSRVAKVAGLVAVACAVLLASSSRAASIKFETKVPGYSSAGWILVIPGSNLGGRIQYSPAYNCWITDRVTRGDAIRVTISPSTRNEYCTRGALFGFYSASVPENYTWGYANLPIVVTGNVTRNQNYDNNYVWVYTSAGYFEKRIPIGTR